jgi:hypothetical protein
MDPTTNLNTGSFPYAVTEDRAYGEVSLDSLDHQLSSSTNQPEFVIEELGKVGDIIGLKLIQCEIPFSFYVFNSTNTLGFSANTGGNTPVLYTGAAGEQNAGTQYWTWTAGTSTVTTLIGPSSRGSGTTADSQKGTILPGNYDLSSSNNSTSILNKWAAAFNTNGITGVTMTYDASSGKISIVNGTGSTLNFGFGPTCTCATWLGFDTNKNYSIPIGGTYIAPYVANVTGPNYVHLHSSLGTLVDKRKIVGPSDVIYSAVLCRVPLASNPGGIIFYQDPSPYYFNIGTNSIDKIKFWLTMGNEPGVILDLNGRNFSLEFAFIVRTENGVTMSRNLRIGANSYMNNLAMLPNSNKRARYF